jgi:hypothetical protein
MRKLSTILIGTLLSVGIASGASALGLSASSVLLDGSNADALVDLELSDGPDGTHTLGMQLHVIQGKVGRLQVEVSSDNDVDVNGVGFLPGTGDASVARIRVKGNGQVDFYFRQSFFHWHAHAGESTDKFFVNYAGLSAGDAIHFAGYRHWVFGSFASNSVTVIPEPSAAIMVGLGMAGLVFAGRKR